MKESTLWLLHILAAAVLVIVIPIHLSNFSSLISPGYFASLTWTYVQKRGADIFYTSVYLVFLGAAFYHGMYGLRSIIFELSLSPRAERLISAICAISGAAAFAFGAHAAIAALFV